jgi:DNA-3-methyladenine glycosylase II
MRPELAEGPRTSRRYAAARRHLRAADPVIARLVDEHPDFDPRRWITELPPMDAFGVLTFQVIGQQLSVVATRAILGRLQGLFGGHLPSTAEMLDADPERVRGVGLSRRKVQTLRAVAERFAAGELTDQGLARLSDAEIETALTAIPGIGPWTVHGFLIIALDRPDVLLPGDLALRRVVMRLYGFDHLPTEPEMLRLAEPWRPYRSLAVSYLFSSEFER